MLNAFLCSTDEAKLLMNGRINAGYFGCWIRWIKNVRKQHVRKQERRGGAFLALHFTGRWQRIKGCQGREAG